MVRVFHDIEGFIYVIGLSHDMIVKLIKVGNSESSIDGERYIKKLIRVPITLPKWSNQDIVEISKRMLHQKRYDS